MQSRKLELEQAKKLLKNKNLSEEAKLVLYTQFPELKEDREIN